MPSRGSYGGIITVNMYMGYAKVCVCVCVRIYCFTVSNEVLLV